MDRIQEKLYTKHLDEFASIAGACFISLDVLETSVDRGIQFYSDGSLQEAETETNNFLERNFNSQDMDVVDKISLVRDLADEKLEKAISTISLSIYFSASTLFARVVDSFENYLKAITAELFIHTPTRMLTSHDAPKIGVDVIIANRDLDAKGLLRLVAEDYVERRSMKNGYKQSLELISAKFGVKDPLDQTVLDRISAIFELRNSILHENGRMQIKYLEESRIFQNNLRKYDYKSRKLAIDSNNIFALSAFLISACVSLEDRLREHHLPEEVYTFTNLDISDKLSHPLTLADTLSAAFASPPQP